MTPIGSNLVTELVNEINQKIEDDKLLLAKKQGSRGVNYLKVAFLRLLLIPQAVCYSALFYAVLVVAVADLEIITLINSFTSSDWHEFFNESKIKVILLAPFILFWWFLREFSNDKTDRQLDDQSRVDQVQVTVDIIEEVLIRHNLITVKEIENFQKND